MATIPLSTLESEFDPFDTTERCDNFGDVEARGLTR